MNIIALQTDIVWEDKPANFDNVRRLIEAAAPAPGTLVVLPEMFATGFSLNVAAIAESPDHETDCFLAHTAREFKIHLLAGLVTMDEDGKGRNQAVLFDPDGTEKLCYTKIHPFSYAGETDHFVAGSEILLFEWAGFKVCPFICYDLRFPEIFRQAVCRGVNLFVVIANWPKRRKHHWEILLQARAIENQAYVVGVNRTGADPKVSYHGHSQIIDPQGRILARAAEEETVVTAEISLAELKVYRERFPALRDIRPEFF
jgi:predicted amidohydrolase